ncbi:MAG: hypothetical protein JJU20_09980 [Opitutales bacterium]|nr:hypothetical protein [Opitutales bacterium]
MKLNKTLIISAVAITTLFASLTTASAQPLKFRNALSGTGSEHRQTLAKDGIIEHLEERAEVRHTHRSGGGSPRTIRSNGEESSFRTTATRPTDINQMRAGPRSRNQSVHRPTEIDRSASGNPALKRNTGSPARTQGNRR